MSVESPQSAKRELRKLARTRRAEREYSEAAAYAFSRVLIELVQARGCTTITAYLPLPGEPDIELFLDWCLENDVVALLPQSRPDGTLDWVQFMGETAPGLLGFSEAIGPVGRLRDAELAVVPALGADTQGGRLGQGMGYYDRALPGLTPGTPTVAVVFHDELVEALPIEPHDVPVSAVVTEHGLHIVAGGR